LTSTCAAATDADRSRTSKVCVKMSSRSTRSIRPSIVPATAPIRSVASASASASRFTYAARIGPRPVAPQRRHKLNARRVTLHVPTHRLGVHARHLAQVAEAPPAAARSRSCSMLSISASYQTCSGSIGVVEGKQNTHIM